jgi:hypothetical protein
MNWSENQSFDEQGSTSHKQPPLYQDSNMWGWVIHTSLIKYTTKYDYTRVSIISGTGTAIYTACNIVMQQ